MFKFCFVLAALAVTACTSTPGGECRMARASYLPFRVVDHHIVVEAKIDQMPATLVFDTGAFTTLLTAEAVKRLHLRTQVAYIGPATGIGGARDLPLVQAKSVDLGGLYAKNFDFVATEPGTIMPAHADGLLSTDMLSRYDVDLDYGGRRIILYDPVTDCSHPSAFLAPPLFPVPFERAGNSKTPHVLVTIGGKRFTAIIDSGAPMTTMFGNAAARLGLHVGDLKTDLHGIAGGVGPRRIVAVRHVFEPITIGDLTVEHMPVALLDQPSLGDFDMLLGLDFQSRVHLWISYSSETLIMQYPPKLSSIGPQGDAKPGGEPSRAPQPHS